MRTNGLFVAVVAVLVGAFGGTVTPAAAQQETPCKAEYSITLSPGYGSKPVSDAVYHSDGESGTIDCGGRTGTIGIDGRYATKNPATCTSGTEGWGVFSYTFDGKTIKDTFTFNVGGISGGYITGTFEGERYSGGFTFTPTEGNCVTAPVTKADIKTDGKMKG
jgi:hypothetical protein